jgi:hypothetical protein
MERLETVVGLAAAVRGSYQDPANAILDVRAALVYATALHHGAAAEVAAQLAVGDRAADLLDLLTAARA